MMNNQDIQNLLGMMQNFAPAGNGPNPQAMPPNQTPPIIAPPGIDPKIGIKPPQPMPPVGVKPLSPPMPMPPAAVNMIKQWRGFGGQGVSNQSGRAMLSSN